MTCTCVEDVVCGWCMTGARQQAERVLTSAIQGAGVSGLRPAEVSRIVNAVIEVLPAATASPVSAAAAAAAADDDAAAADDDVREVSRSDIADEISGIQVGTGYGSTTIGIDAALEAGDAILSRFDVRLRGTVTDAEVVEKAIRDEQKRIAALPDSAKTWTGEHGVAWQSGMSYAVRVARAALGAAGGVRS